jgi:hypothetical protein
MNTISNTSGAYTPPNSSTDSNAGTSAADLSQQSLVKANKFFPTGGPSFNPQAKLQDSGNAGNTSSGTVPQGNESSGHTVGPVADYASKTPPPPEAILPTNSPTGGTYTYQLPTQGVGSQSQNTVQNQYLYRHDSTTGQWERSALPSKNDSGDYAGYALAKDYQGNSFVAQVGEDGSRAYVPGSFTPSGAPDSPQEQQLQFPGSQSTTDQANGGADATGKGNSTGRDRYRVVPPEQQLPTTGPNGETYTYGIVQHGDGDTRQQWLERDDGKGGQTYSMLPDGNKYNYQVGIDSQGHPYVTQQYKTNFDQGIVSKMPMNVSSLPPFEAHNEPMA